MVCLLVVLAGETAVADELEATLDQPLRELSHTVDVHLENGLAVFKVRRTFANSGSKHDEASLAINLPYGAAATGLRIRSADGRWYDAELMERERAAELYRELTGLGPHTPRDPALLQWVWADEVHLQVFPVPPGGESTVEYTLTAPTRYADGRHLFSYPRNQADPLLAAPVLRVFPATPGARVDLDGKSLAPEQPSVLQSPRRPAWFTGKHRPEPGASYASSAVMVRRAGAARGSDTAREAGSLPRSAGQARKTDTVHGARVRLDLRHTYRGDLRVEIIAPSGRWYRLFDRKGGGENDLRQTFVVPQKSPEPAAGIWRLVVSDHAPRDVGSIEGWSLELDLGQKARLDLAAADTPVFIPDATDSDGQGVARVSVSPLPINTVAARLGRVIAGRGRNFLRLEVDAAPRLRPMPVRPRLVFVVDGSHSVGPKGIQGQLQLVRSFIGHVPDARAEVVVYRRRASRLLGRFVGAKETEQALVGAAGQLKPGNGSALDLGIQEAVRLLHGPGGPGYIVMLGDARLRSRWTNRRALELLDRTPAATIAHVVVFRPNSSGVTEERQDGHLLSVLAARRGGVLLRVGGLPATDPKELAPVTLGLVRPIRIDSFRVQGADLRGLPDALREGSGVREMVALPAAPRTVTLVGRIWATSFRRQVQATQDFSRATAAFVFSHDMHGKLSRPQMLRVAMYGRAVSPVTSYLAVEPGVRPSTAGIVRVGGSGRGAGYGAGVGRMRGGTRYHPHPKWLLEPGVRRCSKAHHPASGWSALLTLETTLREVVDVVLRSSATPMARCLVEEAWKLDLSPDSFYREHEAFTLSFP